MSIPKNIYQSWHSHNFHPKIEKIFHKQRSLNPNFRFTLYDDLQIEDFVRSNFEKNIFNAFTSLKILTAKVDFWRYLILYKYGGIYLDIDSKINIDLEKMIEEHDEAILTAETNEGLFVQWALFFSKEHPILEKTIENVTKNIETKRYPNDIVNTTGPGAFTTSLLEIHNKYQETPLIWKDVGKEYNKTFFVNQNKIPFSYRIFGVDFNGNLSFKLKNTKHLYNDKPHWKIEEKKIDLF